MRSIPPGLFLLLPILCILSCEQVIPVSSVFGRNITVNSHEIAVTHWPIQNQRNLTCHTD